MDLNYRLELMKSFNGDEISEIVYNAAVRIGWRYDFRPTYKLTKAASSPILESREIMVHKRGLMSRMRDTYIGICVGDGEFLDADPDEVIRVDSEYSQIFLVTRGLRTKDIDKFTSSLTESIDDKLNETLK
jgi:hypothetical protein